MIVAYVFSFLIGMFGVLQGTLNKQASVHWGLASTIFFNTIVFMGAGVALLLTVKVWPVSFPEIFRLKGSLSNFSWWFILPGLFGFFVVAGLPFVISRIGALKVFLIIIVSQVLVSLIWDFLVEGLPLSPMRLLGACFAAVGIVLVSFKD